MSQPMRPSDCAETTQEAAHARALDATQAGALQAPIDMVLHCPRCGLQHVDAPEPPPHPCEDDVWTNPPHKSHLCHGCGHIWRPADVPTNGVQAVKTTGKADSPLAATQPNAAPAAEVVAERELLAYVLQDEQHNRLTPRVIDIAYTAFTLAKQPNAEDGGSSDWFNDTRPAVRKAVEKLRDDFAALAAPAAAIDAREQCPKCGAPCTTTVNMRGGDHGWGTTDAERTVYRYAPSPASRPNAAPATTSAASARKAWKITVPSGLRHWFTEDDDEVAHFSLPDQGHKIEEYRLVAPADQTAVTK